MGPAAGERDVEVIAAKLSGKASVARGTGCAIDRYPVTVWEPAHENDTQYLRALIGQLRAKIEDDPSAPRFVLTEPGAGYRFADIDQNKM
jgi:hypothetical protein